MKEADTIQELSILGGPLHRLGSRLGLVHATNTIRLGLALGLLTWGVLMLLELLVGGPNVFSLRAIGVHVRFLVAIPLFFVCETWVAPRITEFSRYIVRTGLVPEASVPALAADIRRINKAKDSWLVEAIALVAALGLPAIETITGALGTGSWTLILHATGDHLTLVTGWYLLFGLPVFRFLVLRWLWRLGLWWYFLWRLARLNLLLVPTHSDGVAGLGYIEIVHENFAPLILAISAVYAGQFAEAISSGMMAFETLYFAVPAVILVTAVLFVGPLFLFWGKLWICRETGMREYMSMASRYVNAFDRRWVHAGETTEELQLGSPDLQSLSDLTQSLNVVRRMRSIPAGRRLFTNLAVSAMLPLAPLALLKYPLDEVTVGLFRMLTGW